MDVANAVFVCGHDVHRIHAGPVEMGRVRRKEDVVGIGFAHDDVDLAAGLDLGPEVGMDAGEHAQIVAGLGRGVDGLGRLLEFVQRHAALGARPGRAEDDAVRAVGDQEASDPGVVLDDVVALGRVAEAAAAVECGERKAVARQEILELAEIVFVLQGDVGESFAGRVTQLGRFFQSGLEILAPGDQVDGDRRRVGCFRHDIPLLRVKTALCGIESMLH